MLNIFYICTEYTSYIQYMFVYLASQHELLLGDLQWMDLANVE